MKIFIGIFVVVVLLLYYVFVHRPKSAPKARPVERRPALTQPDSSFHAVSLKFPPTACEAAKAMDGRRFLSSAAPRLPLPECKSLECKCRFVHHKDRRIGDDRRNPYVQGFGGASTGNYEKEQRKRSERRDDPPDDFS